MRTPVVFLAAVVFLVVVMYVSSVGARSSGGVQNCPVGSVAADPCQ